MTIPYKNSQKTKKEQVADMFNSIAHSYDFLNHTLSLGIDTLWRKRAINTIKHIPNAKILDIATGTGDFAIEAAKRMPTATIIGVDISENMMEIGKQKVAKKGLSSKITFEKGDSEQLQYNTDEFDAIIAGFGVRNFEHLELGLQEMYRVLKPGGTMAILEFAMPTAFPVKQLYIGYFKFILPAIGKIFSKDSSAYTYLPESVQAFPCGNAFLQEAAKAGFTNTKYVSLSLGITHLYICKK